MVLAREVITTGHADTCDGLGCACNAVMVECRTYYANGVVRIRRERPGVR